MRRPGRGDHDVDAGFERLDLLVHAGRRRRWRRAAGRAAPPAARARRHLEGQLTGRHQHEAGGRSGLGLARALEQGEAEGERLARAGLGLAAHVAAGEAVGDGQGLDGKGLVMPASASTATRSGDTPRAANVSCSSLRSFRRSRPPRRDRPPSPEHGIATRSGGVPPRPVSPGRRGGARGRRRPARRRLWSAPSPHVDDLHRPGEAPDGMGAEPAVGQPFARRRTATPRSWCGALVTQPGREVDRRPMQSSPSNRMTRPARSAASGTRSRGR